MIDDNFFCGANGRRFLAIATAAGLAVNSVGVHFSKRDYTLSICNNTDFQLAPDRLIRDTVNDSVKYVAKIIG
jgi:hypothetical protein